MKPRILALIGILGWILFLLYMGRNIQKGETNDIRIIRVEKVACKSGHKYIQVVKKIKVKTFLFREERTWNIVKTPITPCVLCLQEEE